MQWHKSLQKALLAGFIASLAVAPAAWAEDVSEELKQMRQALEELKQTVQSQNELIQKQQNRIDELERRVTTQPTDPAPAAMPPPRSAVPPSGVTTQSRSIPGQIGAVLPEIGVVGDIVATSSQKKNDTGGNDRISARELELVVGSYVDPYSRFDSTIAFSDQSDVELEEAYLTRWGLPGDLKARIGRFFPRIGKEGSTHRDSLSTVDEPLVVRRFLGEEGFSRAGLDFTRPLQGPFGWVLEPSAGVLEGGAGEGSSTFGSRRRPTVYSHLKAFRDLGDVSNLELGLTHLAGSKDAGPGFDVHLLGADATYIYHVTPTNKLLVQSEVYVQDRSGNSRLNSNTGAITRFDRHPWGTYLLADYRFAPRWSVGARADQVRLVDATATRHEEQGLSAFLTFYQSEFARWRLQFRHEEDANKKQDNAVFLQGTFAIGTHKHQLQ